MLTAGQTPPSILPHLCGTTLLACKKKNGHLRPIAVREVLRRLVSKCLALAARPAVLSVLAPLQLGVNVKGDCEAIIHAVSHLLTTPCTLSNQKWTSPMPSIPFAVRPRSRKSVCEYHPSPHGWSLVISAIPYSDWIRTPFPVAVGFSRGIRLDLWDSP